MTDEQQAQIAEIEGQIDATLAAWGQERERANDAERELQEFMRASRELRERHVASARRADEAERAASERWRQFRQLEAKLKAAQRRAGLDVTGTPTQALAAHGIASAEAVGTP